MMRLCDLRRRRRPPMAPAAGDRDLQRRVLALLLAAHPLPLTFEALAAVLLADDALPLAFAFARAVRDLAAAGLLRSDGLHVSPTPAAIAYWRLEEDR